MRHVRRLAADPQVPLAVAEQWHNVLLGERTSGKRCDRPLGAIDLARQQLELSEHVAADGGGLAKRYKLDSLTAAGDAETLLLTWPTQGRPGPSCLVLRAAQHRRPPRLLLVHRTLGYDLAGCPPTLRGLGARASACRARAGGVMRYDRLRV